MTARPPPADLSGHVGKLVLCEEFLQNAISAKDWYQVRFDKSSSQLLSQPRFSFHYRYSIQSLPSNVTTDIQMLLRICISATKETMYLFSFFHAYDIK